MPVLSTLRLYKQVVATISHQAPEQAGRQAGKQAGRGKTAAISLIVTIKLDLAVSCCCMLVVQTHLARWSFS